MVGTLSFWKGPRHGAARTGHENLDSTGAHILRAYLFEQDNVSKSLAQSKEREIWAAPFIPLYLKWVLLARLQKLVGEFLLLFFKREELGP